MTHRWWSSGLLLVVLTAGPSVGAAQTAADRRSAGEVRALFEQFNAAWERRDSAFIDRYYAHDSSGVFFFERRQLRGWPRVDTLYRAMFANAARGQVRSHFDVLDVGARGNLAWLAANFRLEVIAASGDTTVDEGRQSVVFERRRGRWQVVHRHTSFQAPPGPQRRVALHTSPGPLWSPADDTTGGPDGRSIRALREQSNAAIARHDTAGIAVALAPNVVVVSSRSATTIGRDANAKAFADQFVTRPDVVYRRSPTEVRLFPAWRMASEQGHWTGRWTDGDGPVTIEGGYFAKWRQLDGRWLIESETYVPERCVGGQYCRTAPAPAPAPTAAQAIDLSRFTLVDLGHEIAADGPAWPGSRTPFKLDTIAATATGAMFRLTLNEHFGTHLDAPRHAAGSGWTNEQIPLGRLMAPVVVIDVRAEAAKDPDYPLSAADITAHEQEFGTILRGAIVLLRTGWAQYWNDPARYFGADTAARPVRLHFPSFGPEAARLLVARGVAVLGVDSPSTDIGAAPTFAVHGILGAANVPALENLTGLEDLPRTGGLLIALPIKTRGGSGGPVRVVALVPR